MPRKYERLMKNQHRLRKVKTLNGIRISELRAVFRHENGKIFRIKNGRRADLLSTSSDRLYVNYSRKTIMASRLVWALEYGWVPAPDGQYVIDHINHNRKDNRLENLQLISREENSKRSLHHSLQGSESSIENSAYQQGYNDGFAAAMAQVR